MSNCDPKLSLIGLVLFFTSSCVVAEGEWRTSNFTPTVEKDIGFDAKSLYEVFASAQTQPLSRTGEQISDQNRPSVKRYRLPMVRTRSNR